MEMIGYLIKIALRITGFSTSVFGIFWEPVKIADREKCKTVKKSRAQLIYRYQRRTFQVTDAEPKRASLPVKVANFKKISSKISLTNAEGVRWRVGYRFIKESSPKREYVFHVYQDSGNNSFHSRIVELADIEISPDVPKTHIGIENTKNFVLTVEKNNGEMSFYIDGILLGEYSVPLQKISDLTISAWSHGNIIPIIVIFEDIRVWAEIKDKEDSLLVSKNKSGKSFNITWYEKWWIKYLILPLLVLLIGAFLVYSLGWNGQKYRNIQLPNISVTEVSPTDRMTPLSTLSPTTPAATEVQNKQSIKLGDSYLDPKSKVVIGVSDISVFQTADISITATGNETEYYKDVNPGKVFYFESSGNRHSLIVKEINYIGSYIDIIINK